MQKQPETRVQQQGQKQEVSAEEKTKWGNMIDILHGGTTFLGKEMEERSFEDECSNHFYLFYRKHVPGTLCLELSVSQRSRVAISCVAEN